MKKEVGQLIKHSGIYGLGTILSKCIGFLMIPVYTHYLVPAFIRFLPGTDFVYGKNEGTTSPFASMTLRPHTWAGTLTRNIALTGWRKSSPRSSNQC